MLALLLREYNSYDPFVSYCRSIRHLIEATTSVHDKRRVIDETARRWNLILISAIREMGYWQLEQGILRTGTVLAGRELKPFSFFTTMLFAGEDLYIEWNGWRWYWQRTGQHSLASVRNQIITDLGVSRASNLPDEVSRQLRALPDRAWQNGWTLMDRLHGLERQVRWLFLRLCPQPGSPLSLTDILSWEAIRSEENSKEKEPDESTLSERTMALADLLRIELPVGTRSSLGEQVRV